MNNFTLNISWAVSHGRDTYGYRICRLDAPMLPTMRTTRYRCNGGGYDMVGTVLGDWLTEQYQSRLLAVAREQYNYYLDGTGLHCAVDNSSVSRLYGLTWYQQQGHHAEHASIDGACGESSVERIAAAIGMRWSVDHRTRSRRIYLVTDYGSAEALKAAQS